MYAKSHCIRYAVRVDEYSLYPLDNTPILSLRLKNFADEIIKNNFLRQYYNMMQPTISMSKQKKKYASITLLHHNM